MGLHYPVCDAPGTMNRKIAEKQLEAKRIEAGGVRVQLITRVQKLLESADTPVCMRHFWGYDGLCMGDFGRNSPVSITVASKRVKSYTRIEYQHSMDV